MTYRERREARAERLRGWAAKREQKAEAGFERARDLGSVIPMGQPILAGHYSQRRDERFREKIGRTIDTACYDGNLARSMKSRAANIELAAQNAIYSDDPDAIPALELRIADLEAERARWKSYNAACRKGGRATADALALLDDAQRATIASMARAGQLKPDGAAPGYASSNLSGRIATARGRLADLQGLVKCATYRCSARFYPVPGRDHPEHCIEHAQEIARARGWSPESSVD